MVNLLKSPSETNILIVDDHPDNLRLLAKILELRGYVVRKSLTGKLALQTVHRNPPNLILLDINMPGMNGYEVCQKLKESEVTSHIPIIFISAMDEISDKVRGFEIGGQDYISKPFQELEVLARIKNQLLIQQQQQLLVEQNQKLEREVHERQLAEAEVRQLNINLERGVQIRTLQLQQSLNFAATLKQISDRMRDCLDQNQILQMVVEALGSALEVNCCHAVLYHSDRLHSIMRYQWIQPGLNFTQEQTFYPIDFPELFQQLRQKYCFAFCPIESDSSGNHAAIFACPIFDNQVAETGILGDLWLYKTCASSFGEMEVNLVEQVANQCAIALRQARLYEAAQAQVQELQRLNQLKDDFLHTISHELRSPIANMKMIIQLLATLSNQEDNQVEANSNLLTQNRQILQYLTILQEECDRELLLVEDLLNLQHLEAGTYQQQLARINLKDWFLHVIEPFEVRSQNHRQYFQVNLAPNLPTVSCDSFSLSRVVTELLNNAYKYTPAGSTIAIELSTFQQETTQQEASISLINQSSWLQFIVTNTGVEIPTAELPRIFDKFYRIPQNDPWKHGGTGLGLALVKKLVEQMGGNIIAKSANNLTEFIVQCPLSC
ncbi:response regulator [Phormidium sp. LEGE 05292]|uniref:hybrid sensor histidine kinase/response regulator n=1 Tax=[Phormidium] sp. LEGE 05292 TaxID=767427 RepID=UPI001880FEFB|nr:response regulator [Phormidium sp. LEGE 05292]MBE9226046.1 response regulator [Phormidium sp. LEGE 05292]